MLNLVFMLAVPAMAADKEVQCGSLLCAADVLTALYGQPFNFEGVPLAQGLSPFGKRA